MEYDRYKTNHKLFIVALISLILSLAFFTMTIFLAPSLLFGVHYDTPAFIMVWREWLEFWYGYTEAASSKLIVLFFFVLALLFAVISYFASNRLESVIYAKELSVRKKTGRFLRLSDEGTILTIKIFFIILLVVMCAVLLSWFLSSPSIRNDIGISGIVTQ